MFSKIFKQKVLVLSSDDDQISTVIVALGSKKEPNTKTLKFNANCRVDLQKIQVLVQKIPSIYIIQDPQFFISTQKVGKAPLKDQLNILKNRIFQKNNSTSGLIEAWQAPQNKETLSYVLFDKTSTAKHKIKLEKWGLTSTFLVPASFCAQAFIRKSKNLPKEFLLFNFQAGLLELLVVSNKSLVESFVFDLEKNLEVKLKRTLFYLKTKHPQAHKKNLYLGNKQNKAEVKAVELIKKLQEGALPFSGEGNSLLEYGAALCYSQNNSSVYSLSKRNLFKELYFTLKNNSTVIVFCLFLLFAHFCFCFSKTKNFKEHNKNLLQDLASQTQYKNNSKLFYLKPNTLSATETLAYIGALFNKQSDFKIQNFSYTLTSYPTQKAHTKKYKAKVGLSFKAPSHKAAREVYDQILSSEKVVDTKEKISWSFQNDVYKTSFFLKSFPKNYEVIRCKKEKAN